jgi:hypothetical protein
VKIEPTTQQRNVESVLFLGDVRYISFRHRTYRIPPVPFKQGELVLDSHVKILEFARKVALTGDADASKQFYRQMSQHVVLLWQHIRPMGKVKRLCWRLGLLPNPFRHASEKEVTAITDFFLQGRMTSSVRLTSEAEARAHP